MELYREYLKPMRARLMNTLGSGRKVTNDLGGSLSQLREDGPRMDSQQLEIVPYWALAIFRDSNGVVPNTFFW